MRIGQSQRSKPRCEDLEFLVALQDVNELNRTLNLSIAQMEDLEAQANKARRRTEDPDKLMEQLQLIQKKQKELMKMQMDLQVETICFTTQTFVWIVCFSLHDILEANIVVTVERYLVLNTFCYLN